MAGQITATSIMKVLKDKADAFMNEGERKTRYNTEKKPITSPDAIALNLTLMEELMNQMLEKQANDMTKFNTELKKRDEEIINLKNSQESLRKIVINKSFELEKLQQYVNRDVIKICGVPEPTGLGPREYENTNDTVKQVMSAADIEITDADISVTHRLPAREQQTKSILLKTGRRDVRNMIMRQKKAMRESTKFKTEYPNAFIVEHLTPLRSKVAYRLRNDATIEKCWTIDGRIKVKKVGADSKTAPTTIDSLAMLIKIGWTQEMVDDLILQE